jgi:hypothetical protein
VLRRSRPQIDSPIFKVDQEIPANDIEKFVLDVMLVPMIFTLHDTQPDHRLVHLA